MLNQNFLKLSMNNIANIRKQVMQFLFHLGFYCNYGLTLIYSSHNQLDSTRNRTIKTRLEWIPFVQKSIVLC